MEEIKVSQQIYDVAKNNIEKLKELFPNVVKDGEVDFDALKEELGEFKEVSAERYELTWAGKKMAKSLSQKEPTNKTLSYCENSSFSSDTTENIYIEGDNLDVLKLLRQNYYGSIKMIYIDPPYNTGNDFIYNDNFDISKQESDRLEGDTSEDGERFVINLKSSNRFHARWLSNFYSRLLVAKDLLKDDGAIFISIDNNEIDNVIKCCNEVFGEENFVDCIIWNKRIPKNDNKGVGNIHEYIVVYTKNASYNLKFEMQKDGLDEIFELLKDLKRKGVPIPEAEEELRKLYNKKGYDRGITLYNNLDNNYEPWGKINMSWPNGNTFGPTYDVIHPATHKPTKVPDRGWRWTEDTFNTNVDYEHVIKRHDGSYVCGNIWFAKDENTQPSSIKYLKDVSGMLLRSILSYKSDGGMELEKLFAGKSYFAYPKPTSLIETLIESFDTKNEIILDYYAGSCTTAHAVFNANANDKGNRKFIMVQYPERCNEDSEAYKNGFDNICKLGQERIKLAAKEIDVDEIDLGFKVFSVSDTNIKWNTLLQDSELDLSQIETPDMMDFTPEANDIDVVYEIMLRQRDVPLSEKINKLVDIGKRTYLYADAYLICLESELTPDMIDKLAAIDPVPVKYVFRDSAFKDNIALKDESFRRLKAIIEKNTNNAKQTYTVEFL